MAEPASILTVHGLSREAWVRLNRQAARENCGVNALVLRRDRNPNRHA